MIAGGIVLLGFALPMAVAQRRTPAPSERGAVMLVSPSAEAETSFAATALPASAHPASTHSGREILREIDDPSSGQRWLLVQDDAHPGGPGLLLLSGPQQERSGPNPAAGRITAASPAAAPAQADLPIVRSGDHVEIEEHSSTVDARLDAVALTPAWSGSAFRARLAIGGQVVRALALGPGRAAFAAQPISFPNLNEAAR
jgi:hypothetical protein